MALERAGQQVTPLYIEYETELENVPKHKNVIVFCLDTTSVWMLDPTGKIWRKNNP